MWLWVFATATTVFLIGRRSQEFLHSVLGGVLHGWPMSDGYWAYRDYDNRLLGLTHLLRKARGLEESIDRQAQCFGRALRAHIAAVMAAVSAAREGPPPLPLREQHTTALNTLLEKTGGSERIPWLCPHLAHHHLLLRIRHFGLTNRGKNTTLNRIFRPSTAAAR